jgi:two-component system LytT family response regulator
LKTILIIDDEQDARDLLRQYLAAYSELTIIGEASNGTDAVALINKLKPTTIFLDVEMPGLNGFEVLTQLEELPEVIFSTAYDHYALKAFEVHAVDYLLKPYGRKRFDESLKRILKNQQSVIPLAEELLQDETTYPSKVILHKGSRKLMVSTNQICYGEAYGDYTKIFTHNDEFLSTRGITELLEKFNPETFIRLHRSHFVNINAVLELKKLDRYFYAILSNNTTLRISDTYLPRIKEIVL